MEFRYNRYAETSDVLSENPDVIVVATSGLPSDDVLASGNELTVSSWDILSGDASSSTNVPLFDDAGNHAAEIIAVSGADLEFASPERMLSPEVGAMILVPFMRTTEKLGVRFTLCRRLLAVEKTDCGLKAICGSDYGATISEHLLEQVVIEHARQTLDNRCYELKALSQNLGGVDHSDLINGKTQSLEKNLHGNFQLSRIGGRSCIENYSRGGL